MMEPADLAREQRDLWNGPGGERWAHGWEEIDQSLVPIAGAILGFADPRPGERVLDVGCGHGTTALALRERVGPTGAVTGVDLSAPLLAIARQRAAGTDIRWIEGDATTVALAPEFDLVFSRFGVMFFADPTAAFTNLRRALAPGGRLAFVCWRDLAANPWIGVPLAAVTDLIPPQPPMEHDGPGMLAFRSADKVRTILARAGFADVRVEQHDTVMRLGPDLAAATAATLTTGPLARATAEVDDRTRATIAERVSAVLAPFATPRGFEVPAGVWLVGARGV
jgi:SAM-dependent methyltransferase